MNRILLLLSQEENRRRLALALQDQYEVSFAATPAELNGPFDLCILDGVMLDRLWDRVAARKELEKPCLLPFLLVTPRHDVGMVTRHLWKTIDELIISPVDILELQARVAVLLQARRLSLEFHRAVFYASPAAIVVLDPSWKVKNWNPAAERILGWDAAEVVGRPNPAITVDREDEYRDLLATVFEGQTMISKEWPCRRKDGEIIHLTIAAAPVHDAFGAVVAAVIVAGDVSERVRAETALRESEAKHRDLVENINDIIYGTDRAGVLTYISPRVQALTGYRPSEMVGRPLSRFFATDETARRPPAVAGPAVERQLITAAGDQLWVSDSSRPVVAGRHTIGVRGVLTDITARKAAEESAAR